MAERRPLTEGLKPPPQAPAVDPAVERQFVHGGSKAVAGTATPSTAVSPIRRVSFSTRMRSEYSEALKRASLERQLNKVEPNSVQDILEEALEPWLRNNGYIR
jgi:hypothetical protein